MSLEKVISELKRYQARLERAAELLEETQAPDKPVRDENVWHGNPVEFIDVSKPPPVTVKFPKRQFKMSAEKRAAISQRMKAMWQRKRVAKAVRPRRKAWRTA